MLETAPQSASKQPCVSVIIPAYNAEDYIGRAIASTLEQSLSNIEVVVVDDASTDGTLSIVRDFAERDSRVKAIACRENSGAAAARNIGIDAANGEWVCPLDADDWFSPNRLSFLLDSCQESPVDMLADDFYLIDHESLEPQSSFTKLNGDTYDRSTQITASFYVNQSNNGLGHASSPGFLKALIRRSFLNEHGIRYRENLEVKEDFILYLDCLIAGARFYFYSEPHYFYLIRPGSLCRRSNEGKVERSRRFIRELKERLKDERVSADPELNSALSHKLSNCEQRLQYRIVVTSLTRKRYLQALVQSLQNPYFFVHLFQGLSFQKIRKAFS